MPSSRKPLVPSRTDRSSAAENPFAVSELSSGYMVAEMAEGADARAGLYRQNGPVGLGVAPVEHELEGATPVREAGREGVEVALEAAGVSVVRYPDAEHGFAHAPERPAHRPADAADAFQRAHTWLTT